MDKRLKIIATASRREIENFARHHDNIGTDSDLECFCGIASFFLVMVAKKLGFKLSLIEGMAFNEWLINRLQTGCIDNQGLDGNHCWVEHNGKIIDITATQFGIRQKVHIVDIGDDNYWVIDRNSTVRRSFKHEWPEDQNPYTYHVELKDRAQKVALKLA